MKKPIGLHELGLKWQREADAAFTQADRLYIARRDCGDRFTEDRMRREEMILRERALTLKSCAFALQDESSAFRQEMDRIQGDNNG